MQRALAHAPNKAPLPHPLSIGVEAVPYFICLTLL